MFFLSVVVMDFVLWTPLHHRDFSWLIMTISQRLLENCLPGVYLQTLQLLIQVLWSESNCFWELCTMIHVSLCVLIHMSLFLRSYSLKEQRFAGLCWVVCFFRLSEMVMKGPLLCKELQPFIPVYVTCANVIFHAVNIYKVFFVWCVCSTIVMDDT